MEPRDQRTNATVPTSSPSGTVALVVPLIPYVAVLIGLYWLSSGWAAMILYHAGVALVLTATGSWRIPRANLSAHTRATAVVLIGGAALVGPIIFGAWELVTIEDFELGQFLASLGLRGGWWVLFAVHYSLVNPVLEELFWRGYLGKASRSITASDLAYAGYHGLVLGKLVTVPWTIVALLALVTIAWVWRQMAAETGGVLVPVLSHGVADASIVVAAALLT
jgi:membrane protease YdiL (CAAX protease family)